MRPTAIGLLSALALLSWCPNAHAGEPKATADVIVNEHDADAVYARARRKAKADDWEGALQDYRRVYALKKDAMAWPEAVNYAVAAERLGHHAEAARIFRYAQRHLSPVEPDYQEYSTKIAARLRALDKRVGTIAVSITPAGSEVLLDGEPLGRAPLDPIYADTGSHSVTVQLAKLPHGVPPGKGDTRQNHCAANRFVLGGTGACRW